jgi:hypothetical protein
VAEYLPSKCEALRYLLDISVAPSSFPASTPSSPYHFKSRKAPCYFLAAQISSHRFFPIEELPEL